MMKKGLCWVRRDLRLHDHHALSRALLECDEVYLCFILDSEILTKLHNKNDRRITFIVESLREMNHQLAKYKARLIIRYGNPVDIIPTLVEELKADALYFNRDYEPYAKKRDSTIEKTLRQKKISVRHFKDHVHFEKNEVLNQSGEIYKIFTPYKNKWLEVFHSQESVLNDYECNLRKMAPINPKQTEDNLNVWFNELGFIPQKNLIQGGTTEGRKRIQSFAQSIQDYKRARDFPFLNQTSLLSPYIRMGNISIRDCLRLALQFTSEGSATWLSELIWREFYQMILDVYPRIEHHAYRTEYDQLEFPGKKEDFKKWCEGQTGYPLVDAAMRCLNATGFMHNRLRMVVASFLTKTLLIDWKKGERYFASQLLDYDLAANNGGWQWCASTGVDAQPYFRIFNPYSQSEKFDPEGWFIRKWCPELSGFTSKEIHAPHDTEFPEQDRAGCFIGQDYPAPIVSYKEQRVRALELYKKKSLN